MFTDRILKASSRYIKKIMKHKIDIKKYSIIKKPDVKDMRDRLRELMWRNVGIVRKENELWYTLKKIHSLQRQFDEEFYDKVSLETIELRNMLIVAKEIVRSALRTKSVGCHYLAK